MAPSAAGGATLTTRRGRARAAAATALAAAGLAAAGCGGEEAQEPAAPGPPDAARPSAPARLPVVRDPDLAVEVYASGLAQPTTMAFLGPDDFLVLERSTGRVRRVVGGRLLPRPVLDVPVNSQGLRGMLGIAINTEKPPSVFVYFTEARDPTGTAADGGEPVGNRLYRYAWNPEAGLLERPELLLDLPSSEAPAHKGGIVVLGPPAPPGPGRVGDGALLYTAIGDNGLVRIGSAQLNNDLEGPPPDDRSVFLRVLQDGEPAPGNPFTPYCRDVPSTPCAEDADCPDGGTCLTQVARYFGYGLRNTYGMALDPVTGDLWDTENGPFHYDEINRVERGFNSGWLKIMGPVAPRNVEEVGLFEMPGGGSVYSDPEFSWYDTVAPTSIVFPVGSSLGPEYDGVALVADHNFGQIYRFPLDSERKAFDFAEYPPLRDLVANTGEERDLVMWASGFFMVTDLKVGPDGHLYVVSLPTGTVLRVRPKGDAP